MYQEKTTTGLVPNSAWKKRVTGIDWLGGDTVNLSIGQGDLLVSPLQMANAYAMIVNEGTIYTPHVLKEIHNPNTGKIELIQPQVLHTSDIPPEVFSKSKTRSTCCGRRRNGQCSDANTIHNCGR
jgi:penicillin-binding protein 2